MSSRADGRRNDDRPNVVVIVSDDQGYADRSALPFVGDVATPGLDRLAAEGVSCTDAYVTAPICSPSRAGLISGSYQQRWGALWFDSSRIGGERYPTIAEALTREGYATGYFGKVHYGPEGPGDRGTPPRHGFDESFYGLAGQSMGRLNYLRHSRRAVQEYGEAARPMGVQPLWNGEQPAEVEGFLTKEIGERARAFMSAHADEPFFAMIAFNAVHNFCWQLPPEELESRGIPAFEDWHPGAGRYVDWYDGAISPNLPNGRAYYRAQLELMDAQIDAIVRHLDELGMGENTLVIYLTDNGGSTCNYGVNTPLRGTKYTLWEGGVRVPFIARWPSGLPAGVNRSRLVSSLDIMPTVLAAAGAGADAYTSDGLDQLALLRGEPHGTGHSVLHWDCGWQWAIRRGAWKLTWVDPDSPIGEYVRKVEHSEPGAGFRLHNLDDDPGETNDLCGEHPDITAQLHDAHIRWRAALATPHD